MSAANDEPVAVLRQQRKAELQLTLFRHGFKIVDNDAGTVYVRVATSHDSGDPSPAEPLMLDYKRDVANYINHGFGTPHDVAMHFVHRYAFRTQSWFQPADNPADPDQSDTAL